VRKKLAMFIALTMLMTMLAIPVIAAEPAPTIVLDGKL
jgi:hypothetical protein